MPRRFQVRWPTVQFTLALDRLLSASPQLSRSAIEVLLFGAITDLLADRADDSARFPVIHGDRRALRRRATIFTPTLVIEFAIDGNEVFALSITAPNGDDRN